MTLESLISSNAVINKSGIKSKKRALEKIAELLARELVENRPPAETEDEIDATDIFQLLTEREKLGSTALGHGVALPHARTDLTDKAIGALLKLDDGVDFDSPDQMPTDLIFALLVPEHFTDEHLKILAYLATLFNDEDFCSTIRSTRNDLETYQDLISWQATSRAS